MLNSLGLLEGSEGGRAKERRGGEERGGRGGEGRSGMELGGGNLQD